MNPSRTGRWAAVWALSAAVLATTSSARPRAELPLPRGAATSVNATPPPSPPPLPTVPAGRRQLLVPQRNPIEVYPPRGAGASAPLTVMLHGMCAGPVDVCDFWSEDGRDGSWLACPAGNLRCGDGFDWVGPVEDRAAAVTAQLAALDEAYGALVDHTGGDVLVGFSRGAFLARDLVYARPGVFRGVVFLGATVEPDGSRLRRAGVTRVVLGAGELDLARPSMRRSVGALAAQGVEARYVSLGRIGHWLPGDLGAILGEAIAWIREGR